MIYSHLNLDAYDSYIDSDLLHKISLHVPQLIQLTF